MYTDMLKAIIKGINLDLYYIFVAAYIVAALALLFRYPYFCRVMVISCFFYPIIRFVRSRVIRLMALFMMSICSSSFLVFKFSSMVLISFCRLLWRSFQYSSKIPVNAWPKFSCVSPHLICRAVLSVGTCGVMFIRSDFWMDLFSLHLVR